MKRRRFLKAIAAAGLADKRFLLSQIGQSKGLNILVLGGTNFVGPSIVNAALGNGHNVTLFNRGITNPQLFRELDHIKGDRKNGPAAYRPLLKHKWDVVIDVWPEKSKLVDEATNSLRNNSGYYIFISSISVYNDFQEVGLHEESDVVGLDLSKDEWGYSEEKLAAENFVRNRFSANHTILRPGPIKGWRDPSVDLLYWCLKLNRHDSIIAPGSGKDPLQFIDVKDVARMSISATENNWTGIYNCVGPRKDALIWKDFLNLSKEHFQSETRLVWADEEFLRENEVMSFSDLPLWAPLSEDKGFMQISNKKIVDAGFVFTSIAHTLDDCLQWFQENHDEIPGFGSSEVGLGLERTNELRLIRKFES